MQVPAEGTGADRSQIPEGQHHQVLRMSQSQRIQHGLVRRDHRARGYGQAEADLLFQLEKIFVAKNCTVHVAASSLKDA